jgi:hypothetical protein
MVSFQTKNANLCRLWRVLQWKMFLYFMSIWSIFRPFGIFSPSLVHFTRFGLLYQEKSGNPDDLSDHKSFAISLGCKAQLSLILLSSLRQRGECRVRLKSENLDEKDTKHDSKFFSWFQSRNGYFLCSMVEDDFRKKVFKIYFFS